MATAVAGAQGSGADCDAARGTRLQCLLFGAEQAEATGQLQQAEASWLELRCFLTSEAVADEAMHAHAAPLLDTCGRHLAGLLLRPDSAEQEQTAAALEAAGVGGDFEFDVGPGPSMLEAARQRPGPLRELLGYGRALQTAPAGRSKAAKPPPKPRQHLPPLPPPRPPQLRPEALQCGLTHGTDPAAAMAAVPAADQGAPYAAGAPMSAAHAAALPAHAELVAATERASASARDAHVAAPQAGADAAGVAAAVTAMPALQRAPSPGFYSTADAGGAASGGDPGGDRQLEADSSQGAAEARRGAGRLRQGHISFAPVLRPGAAAQTGGAADSQERKRDAEGKPKVTGAARDRWAKCSASPDQEADDSMDIDADVSAKEPGGGFQTARAKLATELRAKGLPYPQRPPPATAGEPVASSAAGSGCGGGGRAALGGPARLATRAALGPGRGGGGVARGGFKPPRQRGAGGAEGNVCGGHADGTEEAESLYSAHTLQLLAGPDGQVPEAIAKLGDPALVDQVCNGVVAAGAGRVTSWEDVAGQQAAKDLLQELVVWPMLNPALCQGARAPARGLLLFGPPGTGKTLIGRAIASNIRATFFSISASSLTSKWIGEGEKMVRALFTVAECLQPAVIFIDEIDSILSARKAEGEHEASRRLKTEILTQMEGVDAATADRRILLVAATNRPEELDEAARRRLPKQLYIPLPCASARRLMLDCALGKGDIAAELTEAERDKVVERTAGYSGSDMRDLIQEACSGPLRDAARSRGAAFADLKPEDLRPVVLHDFKVATKAVKAKVEPQEITRYEEYDMRHGAKYMPAGAADMEEDDDGWDV